MGTGEGAVIELPSLLTSALDGGESVSITPRPLNPRGKNPDVTEYEVEQKTQYGTNFYSVKQVLKRIILL